MNTYLDKYSKYSKETKWEDHTPRNYADFRKRVRRETARGKTTLFHENMEDYIQRQLKAHTATRVGIVSLLLATATFKSMEIVTNYFHDIQLYKGIKSHPSYFKLGKGWTFFYIARPLVLGYMTYRSLKLLYKTAKQQWSGQHNFVETILMDEKYYFDFHRDRKDGIAVNFRYSDHLDDNPRYSHFNPDIFKADADYAKGLVSYFQEASMK